MGGEANNRSAILNTPLRRHPAHPGYTTRTFGYFIPDLFGALTNTDNSLSLPYCDSFAVRSLDLTSPCFIYMRIYSVSSHILLFSDICSLLFW